MADLVSYDFDGSVATIAMDDGKVNVLSPAMLAALEAAFDEAAADEAAVILTGREGRFSAGFDMSVMTGGGDVAVDMVVAGFRLAERMLAYPEPLVAACTGHALAMGVFLLLCADYRLVADGAFKIGANEVAIGLTMPHTATEICRQRVAIEHLSRVVIESEIYSPTDAVGAGFVDIVVPPGDLGSRARAEAERLVALNRPAYRATKLRVREQTLAAVAKAIAQDEAELRVLLASMRGDG